MATINTERLREHAQKLIRMIDTKNDWIGLTSGQTMFLELLNDIRWEIDGDESEVLRKLGLIESYKTKGAK